MTPDHDRSRSPIGRTGLADLLRGHRRTAGLTQAELASRAGVGVRTVRDLERGRAARPQRTTVELLADALALTGGARAAFRAAARPAATAPPHEAAGQPRPPPRRRRTTRPPGSSRSPAPPAPPPVRRSRSRRRSRWSAGTGTSPNSPGCSPPTRPW
ncbi:helix-turn-helix domain-containing protein [Micromonospora sp. R77]|nr:helix-turn-helix domain-containing protein [Micromonospora sp. R77]